MKTFTDAEKQQLQGKKDEEHNLDSVI